MLLREKGGSRRSPEVEKIKMGSLVARLGGSEDSGKHREGMEARMDLEQNKNN